METALPSLQSPRPTPPLTWHLGDETARAEGLAVFGAGQGPTRPFVPKAVSGDTISTTKRGYSGLAVKPWARLNAAPSLKPPASHWVVWLVPSSRTTVSVIR